MGGSNFYMANKPVYIFIVDEDTQIEGIKNLMRYVHCTRAKIMYQIFLRGENLLINNHRIKLINKKTDYQLFAKKYVDRVNARYNSNKAKEKYLEDKLKFIETLKTIKK